MNLRRETLVQGPHLNVLNVQRTVFAIIAKSLGISKISIFLG
jgi:hypothetical protein